MIHIYNQDCMEAMASMQDNQFDLAIVDPPYGIGGGSCTTKKAKWDDTKIPTKKYFLELVRVSKNQIVWGGNYMSTHIPFNSTHTIIWDKQNGASFMSDGELAFTSFSKNTTVFFRLFWMSNMMDKSEKPLIHPTQKPISLYTWLLDKYAKKGWKILDTHLGSGSSAIAAHNMGYEFHGYELDKEYYLAAKERLENHQRQLKLPLEI
jgi:site-specific DNA-methyltransferase (adenine-specific)